jgi:hypothetical protein
MKVRYVISPILATPDLWVISITWSGLFNSLRKLTDFRSVVHYPRNPTYDLPVKTPATPDKIMKDLYHDAEISTTPSCLNSDVLIFPIPNRVEDVLKCLQELVPLNLDSFYVFVWSDKFGPLEKEVIPVIESLLPKNQFHHWTHWDKPTFSNHITADFCYDSSLELPISPETKVYDFGFSGYFNLKKNHKWLSYASKLTEKKLSVIGGTSSHFSKSPELLPYLDLHGTIQSWDRAWPIMAQSWIHLNSHKPQHIPVESIVRRITQCSEAGTICLIDHFEPVAYRRFPGYSIHHPLTLPKILALAEEDKLQLIQRQREFCQTLFNPEEKLSILLPMIERRVCPSDLSLRYPQWRR